MNKFFVGITCLFLAQTGYSTDCVRNPIQCQILNNSKKLGSSIDKKYAMRLSNIIHKTSKKLSINAQIFTAILAQESSYDNSARNCVTGLTEYFHEVTVCVDYGISQINHKTAKAFQIDLFRVMYDLEYSVESGARVLKGFQDQFPDEEEFFLRYNCGSRGSTKRTTCQTYKRLVSRFL